MAGRRVKSPHGKYAPDLLIKMFRKAAALRNDMLAAGFTDNGGAIHCAERILDILGQRLNYPGLKHGNALKYYEYAEFSDEAWELHQSKRAVLVEHVAPRRHLTQMAIERIQTASDAQFQRFVKRHYKTVLLSPDETLRLNRLNRSTVSLDRLSVAGVKVAARRIVPAKGLIVHPEGREVGPLRDCQSTALKRKVSLDCVPERSVTVDAGREVRHHGH